MIPVVNPGAQYHSHKAEIDEAIHRVLDRGRYIPAEEVRTFETDFASYIGLEIAIGIGSGTGALHMALRVCDRGAGSSPV